MYRIVLLLSSPSSRTGGPRNDTRWVPFLSGEIAPAQKFLSDPGGSADPGLRGGLQQVFLAKYHDGPAASRQGGVEELTRQERQVSLREQQADVVVFRALRLVHGDGVGEFEIRPQLVQVKSGEFIVP